MDAEVQRSGPHSLANTFVGFSESCMSQQLGGHGQRLSGAEPYRDIGIFWKTHLHFPLRTDECVDI